MLSYQIDYIKPDAVRHGTYGASDAALLSPLTSLITDLQPTYSAGSMVWVVPDMTPGNNREGGTARVESSSFDNSGAEIYNLKYVVGTAGEKNLPIAAILPAQPVAEPAGSRHGSASLPTDIASLQHLLQLERAARKEAEQKLTSQCQEHMLELRAREAEVAQLKTQKVHIATSLKHQKARSEELEHAHSSHVRQTDARVSKGGRQANCNAGGNQADFMAGWREAG